MSDNVTVPQEFLDELTALSKKYDLWIGGCGCCESPYILNRPPNKQIAGGKLIPMDNPGYVHDSTGHAKRELDIKDFL